MAVDDVLRQMQELHDHLLAQQPTGSAHDRGTCSYCTTTPEEAALVKTYTEAELTAEVASAVTAAVGDLRSELDKLRASQEATAIEERIATAVAEATTPLQAQVTELQTALDAATLEVATEKAARETLEAEKVETARLDAIAARKDDRLAKVKEAAKDAFDDDYLTKNADRWAAMTDEDFAERLAEYAVFGAKSGGGNGGKGTGIPTTTALTAAVQDKGAGDGTPVSAVKELGQLRRQGIDVRTI